MEMFETVFVSICYIILILLALAACIGVIATVIWGIALLIKTWREDNG